MKINQINQKNPVFYLACFSIVLWFMSLACNALILGLDANIKVTGLSILASGWLSLIFLNFAWFANIFFIKAGVSLLSNKRTVTSAVVAGIFSLNTFFISKEVLKSGFGSSILYGYGWGAILWLLSIFLMLAAAGTQLKNSPVEEGDYLTGKNMQISGLSVFSLIFFLTAYFSIHDRLIANNAESRYLNNVAFKHGKVCSTIDGPNIDPIKNFSGTLVVNFRGVDGGSIYPFSNGKDLVEWGIPHVIINEGNGAGIYGSAINSDKTKSRAILYIKKTDTHGQGYILISSKVNVKMVEESSNRIVFDTSWESNKDGMYCPSYSYSPHTDEQPRVMIMDALGFSKNARS